MHLSASVLSANRVKNSRGEDLGKIEDFVIDVDHGRVDYAVLSFRGFLGIGDDRLLAVPLHAMSVDANRKCFVLDILDVDEKRGQEGSGSAKDHSPKADDVRWLRTVPDCPDANPAGGADLS